MNLGTNTQEMEQQALTSSTAIMNRGKVAVQDR